MEIMILEKEGQKFEVPISQYHKNAFEERHGRGSLQRLYTLLAQDCSTFTEIGEIFLLSRERVRQIYKKRLAPYLPKKNGRERRRACTLSRIHFYPSQKRSFQKYVLEIWRKAKKLGFSVSHVNHIYTIGNENANQVLTVSQELLINGKLCKIHSARNCWQPSPSNKRFYTHVSVAKIDSYAFFIVAVDVKSIPKTYFIIPRDQLNNVSSSKDKRGCMSRYLYLPITASRYETNNPWRTYENAWHLLA